MPMTPPGDEPAADDDGAMGALMAAILAVTPNEPPSAAAEGTWLPRRRDQFDTLDPYGDA